jgi:hypothetical protein
MSEQEEGHIKYKYAWEWFKYHANQRITEFYHFLIIFGAIAFAYLFSDQLHCLLALLGMFVSIGFYLIEIRNVELLQSSRNTIEDIEQSIGLSIYKNGKERMYLNKSIDQGSLFPRLMKWLPKWIYTHSFVLRITYLFAFMLSVAAFIMKIFN